MMTTTSVSAAPASATRPGKVTARRVLHSEWAKFWSLRSNWITLASSVVGLIAFGVIAAYMYKAPTGAASGPSLTDGSTDAVSLALLGVSTIVSLIVGSLGVLMFAGEYSTGMIRSTFAAVPNRVSVLLSKSAVVGLLVLVLTSIGALVAFLLGAGGLSGESIAMSLGDTGVLRCLLGAGAYLALVTVFGVALGSLLRSPAGGIASVTGIMLVLPTMVSLLPDSMADMLQPYLPSTAGEAVFSLHQSADALSPGAGLAVLAGWVALALTAAAIRLKRTDA